MQTLIVNADLAERTLRQFGLDAQLQVLQEELAEAIVAISHLRRGRCGAREELTDTIATCWWSSTSCAPNRSWLPKLTGAWSASVSACAPCWRASHVCLL